MEKIPDFDTAVDVVETDQGNAIQTNLPDFSTAEDVIETNETHVQPSPISKFFRELFKHTPLERVQTSIYISENSNLIPEHIPGENFFDYKKRLEDSLGIQERESEIASEGVVRQFEAPMEAGILTGIGTKPLETLFAVGSFSVMDHFFNARRFVNEKFPNTHPVVKDIIEIADFAVKGGIIGKGIIDGKKFLRNRMENLGIPKNVNIDPDTIGRIRGTPNLTEKEKVDLLKTIGVEDKHVNTSLSGGIPINVPTEKVLDLATKPYWEIAKNDLLGTEPSMFGLPKERAHQDVIKSIKLIQEAKELSNISVSKLKKFIGIENLKKAEVPNLERLEEFMKDLKKGDKFLSEKQVADLKNIIKDLPNPEVTPKRIVVEKFGEKSEILGEGIVSKIQPELVPTVDIKQGHPLIKGIVDKVSEKMMEAEGKISERNKKLDKMVTDAEKSRAKLLPTDEKLKRMVSPQNKEIFSALSGDPVQLTKQEAVVVAYLRDFFQKARKDLALSKYRKNYITHLDQSFVEKVLDKGIFGAIREIFQKPKKNDLPVDIMLELDNIIGSEKFFKFALERKGGIEPTTNIRRIINQYSALYERKKVLDQILPEGQAITKNLLQGKSAVWMKKFLQNLKGRGLDNNFRNGPMGWLSKVADGIVDVGYLKLLGFNWKSALKNLLAGETNSWIYQDFPTYLKGKERFISNPKKAHDLANEYGALEGTYADFAQKGIGSLKKYQELAMVGQKAGEIEIRSSIFVSQLSEKEWSSGKLSAARMSEIKDAIAITQGIFTKWESPILLQTWYGRMFFQMNRWRITNAMLLKRIVGEAVADIKKGNFKSQAVSRMGKSLVAYGTGMYISYQLAQAGYKTASNVAKNMAETINGMVSLFSEGDLVKMFTENPTLQVFKEISNSIQNTAKYLHVPGARKARGEGIEDTYIAPIETVKDVINFLGED